MIFAYAILKMPSYAEKMRYAGFGKICDRIFAYNQHLHLMQVIVPSFPLSYFFSVFFRRPTFSFLSLPRLFFLSPPFRFFLCLRIKIP